MKALHRLLILAAIAISIPQFSYAQPCFPVLNPNNSITIDLVNFNGLPAPPADINLNSTNDMEIIITNNNPAVSVVYISAWLNQDGNNTYFPMNQMISNVPMTFPFGPATYGIQTYFTPPAGFTFPVTSILITVTPSPIPPNPCLPTIDGPSLEIESRNHNSEGLFAVISTDGIEKCFEPFNPYNCGATMLCPHPTNCPIAIPLYQYPERLVADIGAHTDFPVGIGSYIPSSFTQTARVYEEVSVLYAPNTIYWQTGGVLKAFDPVYDIIHSPCTGDWAHIPTLPGGFPSNAKVEIVADFAFDPPDPNNEYHVFYWIDGQQIMNNSQGVPGNVVVPVVLNTANGMQGKDYGGLYNVCREEDRLGEQTGKDLNMLEPVSVFPNPFQDQTAFLFELTESNSVQWQILDLQGKILLYEEEKYYKEGNHQISLNANKLSSGLYLLQIQLGDQLYTEKIMKH